MNKIFTSLILIYCFQLNFLLAEEMVAPAVETDVLKESGHREKAVRPEELPVGYFETKDYRFIPVHYSDEDGVAYLCKGKMGSVNHS